MSVENGSGRPARELDGFQQAVADLFVEGQVRVPNVEAWVGRPLDIVAAPEVPKTASLDEQVIGRCIGSTVFSPGQVNNRRINIKRAVR